MMTNLEQQSSGINSIFLLANASSSDFRNAPVHIHPPDHLPELVFHVICLQLVSKLVSSNLRVVV
jgi:hypothetical protein